MELIERVASDMVRRLVMKFGGTSVANVGLIKQITRHVQREIRAGYQVVVVVSAMSNVTNQLIRYCEEAAQEYDMREYDAVVSSGEQIVSGLLAIVLNNLGLKARSWQGWQIPLRTSNEHGSVRLTAVDGSKLLDALSRGEVPVISGFQGITDDHSISTLGRGGSDTTAVAVAASIQAKRCDIYTDVDGIYTADPRIVPRARRLERLAIEEALNISWLGARILQPQAVEFAMRYGVQICVRSSFSNHDSPNSGTIVCKNGEALTENMIIACLPPSRALSQLHSQLFPDRPLSCILEDSGSAAMISVIGSRVLAQPEEVVNIAVGSLTSHGTHILDMATSGASMSLLVDAARGDFAVRTLHTAYGLDS